MRLFDIQWSEFAVLQKRACFLLLVIFCACTKEEKNKLYTAIKPDESGVLFSNTITISDSLVLPGYEYIYNGGGVGVIDVNNDGYLDLFFSGNLISSKLYLNKGGLKFEDITEKAGLTTHTWVNGVSIVDINQDGFMDIYLSVGGHQFTPESERANLLYINNKNSTFTEKAASYGLNDKGYGIQSVFFDYDKDGDLDMYLLRNSFVTYPRNNARPKATNGEAPSTDKLFRNNGNNTFTDVSNEANILIEGFGLGINVTDINADGWPDLYIANDFITNDLLWINNKNGTFTNEIASYLKHQTFNGMGVDVSDFNNDGLQDIIELDMLPPDNKRWKLTPRGNNYDEFQNGISKGYEPQYVRNTLQLNNGNGTFSEIGQLAGIEATDWSWSALFIDMDHDGWRDLFITNGYGRDITNLDFIVYGDQSQAMGMDAAGVKERQKLLREIPGINVYNYFFCNNRDLTFQDKSNAWASTTPSFSNGAAYADLDNDGDRDLITNNIDEPASIWQSNLMNSPDKTNNHFIRLKFNGPGANKNGLGVKVILRSKDIFTTEIFSPYRGYLSTMEPFMHFGIGPATEIDSIIVIWPDGKQEIIQHTKANSTLTIEFANAREMASIGPAKEFSIFSDVTESMGIEYSQKENVFTDFKVQPLLPVMHSRNGPGIAIGDVNGDGLEDCYVGGGAGSSGRLFIQQNTNGFNSTSILGIDSLSDQMGVLLFDADKDADLDLYIVAGGSEQRMTSAYYQDKLLMNDGKGNFTLDKNALPVINHSGSTVNAFDFDHDGDLDLFRGSRLMPAAYPIAPKSYLLRNDSDKDKVKFTSVEAPFLNELGMVTSALCTDYDNDTWIDLMITGEFMPLTSIHNNKGVLQNESQTSGLKNSTGWWNSISAGDFDDDGDMDYIAGNLGLNTRFKASIKEPICIYAKDFNNDGTVDPVMSQYRQGVKYANHTRDILISQITAMRARFRTYTDYSNASFEETLFPEETANAYVVTAEDFESKYIENLGQGKFKMKALPVQAQFAPLFGINIDDWDGDDLLDAMIVGNLYSLEVITGRADANPGLILKGDGRGGFAPIPVSKSGFKADQDAKGLARMRIKNGKDVLLVTNNNSRMQVFSNSKTRDYFGANNDDLVALLNRGGGKKRKYEFYYGSTYLSNGSRGFFLPVKFDDLEIIENTGKSRKWR